jgi:hypothetical protein
MTSGKPRWRAGLCALIGLLLLAQAGGRLPAQTSSDAVWPNAQSKANSDDWIRLHHDQIRQMKPRLLVLNFVNGLSAEEATRRVNALIAAIRESSRYHGYKDPGAPAFLDYQLYKLVDLTDPVLPPEDQRMDGNSSLYPRPPDWKEGMVNFQYAALFSDRFVEYYNISDPDRPSHKLTLEELVNRGIIHEVWFLGLQGRFGAPFECTEGKQVYNIDLRKIEGRYTQAGSGGTEEQPFVGRSLRILHINPERGPGCALQSLGQALEALAKSRAVPYFTRYFTEYAGFDLSKRYNLPFDRLSGRDGGTELEYPTPSSMKYRYKGEYYTLRNYIPVAGCTAFTPVSRREYDLDGPASVLTTIEHYRLGDGENGKDRAETWTIQKYARYRGLANDCMGPWLVYWQQNMPGLDNKARDDNGRPMKNWWPFLFY